MAEENAYEYFDAELIITSDSTNDVDNSKILDAIRRIDSSINSIFYTVGTAPLVMMEMGLVFAGEVSDEYNQGVVDGTQDSFKTYGATGQAPWNPRSDSLDYLAGYASAHCSGRSPPPEANC